MVSNRRWMLIASIAIALFASFGFLPTGTAQTPEAISSGCAIQASPVAEMEQEMDHAVSGHESGHGAAHEIPFDLFYIDMMIPHHESVIALADVARDQLTHPDLIAMAEAIIATQQGEITQLQAWRDAWFPDAELVGMDAMMSMPGLESAMSDMHAQMSSEWQVQQFCAAENPDLAFIDQVIPHHEMAVVVSQAAPGRSEHPELQEMAIAVIAAQQAEIDLLNQVRAELTGEATPEA